jgi:hypothetical protein
MIIKRFFQVNSNEIVIFKVNFNIKYEKFRVFVTFYIPGSGAGPKNFGSGSSSGKKLLLHRLRLWNTGYRYSILRKIVTNFFMQNFDTWKYKNCAGCRQFFLIRQSAKKFLPESHGYLKGHCHEKSVS